MIDQTIFEPKQLLVQPLQRVGYSDRTAWLMAAMSELAYLEFEDADRCGLDDGGRGLAPECRAAGHESCLSWQRGNDPASEPVGRDDTSNCRNVFSGRQF